MNHVDVFTGIGGFALAAQQVWGDDYKNICFCDNNKFCQEVIKKNFGKESLIYGDIRKVTKERIIADTRIKEQRGLPGIKRKENTAIRESRERRIAPYTTNNGCDRDDKKSGMEGKIPSNKKQSRNRWTGRIKRCRGEFITDLLTGGFPCQPFSAAGKRGGKADDRYLWPEMLRVIRELKPRWIIGENVAGILSMAEQQSDAEMDSETDNDDEIGKDRAAGGILYDIIKDIEQAGYDVQTFVIPACAINASHRRDRVWIVANSGHWNGQRIADKREFKESISRSEDAIKFKRSNSNAGKRVTSNSQRGKSRKQTKQKRRENTCRRNINASDSIGNRSKRMREKQKSKRSNRLYNRENPSWESNWLEVATEFCRVDDGLPVGLDGFKLTKAGHRVERLKALGNAIVPQVAIEIMKAIKAIDHEKQMD